MNDFLTILQNEYPDAKIALDYENGFQLLVAVILSAQCTDERVNKVTPSLFDKYPDAKAFSEADIEDIKKMIFSTGFYNNKAKNILAASKIVVSEFGGEIPKTMNEMLIIPGVARKTANVVLSELYRVFEGITVDTHVIRLAGRLGLVDDKLVKSKNAVKIEQELMKIVPKKYWGLFPHFLILHGRNVCKAKKPNCKGCALNKVCPSSGKV
ncbi:MAG: endonuclease III [Candidatus Gracilibacteria bacterium]|jgi:endonuclease-3|nr:endonuclease III [Candidatus Gracilibacteria bacterium]